MDRKQVPQYDYCQSGQIMTAATLLKNSPTPDDIDTAISGKTCLCGTHTRIRNAIHQAAKRNR